MSLIELAKKLHLTRDKIDGACDYLLEQGEIFFIGDDSVIHKESCDYIKTSIFERLKDFHKNCSYIRDVSQEDIRSKISPLLNQRLYETILRELKDEGKIEVNQGRIRISGFKVMLGEEQKHIYDYLDKICRDYHFRPLPLNVFEKIKDRFGKKEVEDVMRTMIGDGRLIRLNNNRLIHVEAINDVKRKLQKHIEEKGRVTLGEFVEVLRLGRTQIQPIFDYLDAIRFTIRIEDYRVLYKVVETGQPALKNNANQAVQEHRM